jgi:hypothetical protein
MSGIAHPGTEAHWGRAALAWLATRPGRRIAVLLLLLIAGQAAFSIYESEVLGLPLVREAPPAFATYQLVQTGFAILLSAMLVAALVAARARPSPFETENCRPLELWAGAASLAAAAAATLYFLVDPAGFHGFAQEDRPLEWASALFLLGAAGLFGLHALRALRDRINLVLAGGLCLVLLVIGMEEISWGQRLFGFATPDRLAEMNWQAEFNFHNVQTDLSETLYYFGAGLFLIALPLLRDLLPVSLVESKWLALAPRRSVAVVSAPVAVFNYGHWDLLPIQLSIFIALWALLAWRGAAAVRGDRREQAFFLAAAAAVLVGQALFLIHGSAMADLPDATEYKEFFIALGFAWHAATLAIFGAARRSEG